MRHLLLALPFALLPLGAAHAASHEHEHHDHDHQQHGSLTAHEHGVASLNVALDGQTLEIQLQSPAINLLGFEHEAASEADRARVADVRRQLEQPQALFALPIEARCTLREHELDSPLFAGPEHADHEDGRGHSDIDASYRFTCASADALGALELGNFFASFPGTEKLQVQLIGPGGQQGAELSPGNTR